MKKYLFIIIVLISSAAKAQYTPMSAFGYQMKYLKVDSGFALPMRDTSIGRGTTRPGLMVINTQDTLPYYFNGSRWKPVYVDSSGVIQLINTKVDSVTVNGNTLFYWIGGLGYGATLNKLDSIHVSNDSIFTCIAGNCTFQYTTSVGSGTVTSIMAGFGLTGDTITASGTIAVDTTIFHTSAYNNVTFAAISHTHSASDIISGTLPIVRGGTGLSGIGSVGQVLRVAASGTGLEYFTPVRVDSTAYHTIGQSLDSSYFTIIKPNGTVDTVRFVGGNSSSYTLPVASSSTLGGVKIGNTLSVDGSGVINTTGAQMFHQSNIVSDGAGLIMYHVFNWFNYLNLSANYHTLYIEFPTVSSSGGALKDGYFHEFVFNKNVDSVIFNSEANAFPASMRIRAGDYIKFVYSAADSTWHGGGSSGINTVPVITQSTDPTTAQITIGQSAIYKNSTTGNVYLWANIGGTLYKTQLL